MPWRQAFTTAAVATATAAAGACSDTAAAVAVAAAAAVVTADAAWTGAIATCLVTRVAPALVVAQGAAAKAPGQGTADRDRTGLRHRPIFWRRGQKEKLSRQHGHGNTARQQKQQAAGRKDRHGMGWNNAHGLERCPAQGRQRRTGMAWVGLE